MRSKSLFDQIDALLQQDLVDPSKWYGAIFYAALLLILALSVAAILARAVRRLLDADQHGYMDRTAISFLAELAQLTVYVVFLVAYLHIIPSLRSVGTAVLTSVSVISLIVGFAAQNALSNVIAGVAILLYRPFQVGNWIQVNGPKGLESGVVESLTLGYTEIRTADDRRVVIPNSQMASQTTINFSKAGNSFLVAVPLELDSTTRIEPVRTAMLSFARSHALVARALDCRISAVNQNCIQLTLRVWCRDMAKIAELQDDLLGEVARLVGPHVTENLAKENPS